MMARYLPVAPVIAAQLLLWWPVCAYIWTALLTTSCQRGLNTRLHVSAQRFAALAPVVSQRCLAPSVGRRC